VTYHVAATKCGGTRAAAPVQRFGLETGVGHRVFRRLRNRPTRVNRKPCGASAVGRLADSAFVVALALAYTRWLREVKANFSRIEQPKPTARTNVLLRKRMQREVFFAPLRASSRQAFPQRNAPRNRSAQPPRHNRQRSPNRRRKGAAATCNAEVSASYDRSRAEPSGKLRAPQMRDS
jgi:hypothetical protein